MDDRVGQVWDELGTRVRALGGTVFVRTDLLPEKSPGGILYPSSSFYDGPLHMRLISGTVLAVGPAAAPLNPGDRVCFQRKFFARWQVLRDGSFVGWLNVHEITGVLDESTTVDNRIDFPEGARAVRELPA